MKRKHLPKINIGDFPETGGWAIYSIERDGEKILEVSICCPTCTGTRWAMITNHSVESDGEVNRSMACNNCPYHEFVIFDDWNPEHYKKAGEDFVRSK